MVCTRVLYYRTPYVTAYAVIQGNLPSSGCLPLLPRPVFFGVPFRQAPVILADRVLDVYVPESIVSSGDSTRLSDPGRWARVWAPTCGGGWQLFVVCACGSMEWAQNRYTPRALRQGVLCLRPLSHQVIVL